MDNLQFKNYEIGMERDIVRMFYTCFGKEMSLSYWKWRFEDNPLKRKLIKTAYDKDQLVAHYAVSPVELFIGGKIFNAGLSMTTMTHPDYVGKGLFTNLANRLFEENGENGDLEIIFGIPNANSKYGFTQKLNFRIIHEIQTLFLNMERKEHNDNCSQCIAIKNFDVRFDDFILDDISRKYQIFSARSSDYLNWRYVDNPEKKYMIYGYIEENKVLGYIVLKGYKNSMDFLEGDIIDVLAASEKVFYKLIQKALDFFGAKSISKVNIWMNDPEFRYILINEMGFREEEQKFPLIVRKNTTVDVKGIFSFDNWYFSMGDIDIF